MKKRILAAAGATALLTLAASPVSAAAPTGTETIAAIASGDENFSTLVAAADAAGLIPAIDECGDDPVTIFAPTNDAFAAALTALGLTAEELLADTETLTSILTYHIVAGVVPASAVVGLDSATTLNGATIDIAVEGESVVLNGSVNVVTTDINACNGVIHVIDAVLVPPAAPAAPADTTTIPTAGGPLPDTGSTSTGLVVTAAIALLAGLGIVAGTRRRTA
jgi:LPXTG-motif cell wall-anchored protein